MAEITAHSVALFAFDGTPVERPARQTEWDAVAATKAGYQHYLRKEINEQPQAWIDTLSGRATTGSAEVRFETHLLPSGGPEVIGRIVMVSAGASWISSLVGKFMLEELCGIPAEVDYSAEFRYRSPAIDARTMIIAVSQSGETADTLAAMEEGKRRGAHLVALTNTVDSSIARKANAQLYTRCGPEISVTTTKCFLTQIEAFYLLAIHLASRMGRIKPPQAEELLQPVFAIPAQIETILAQERQIEKIARKYGKARDFLYLGRGINLSGRARRSIEAQGNFLHSRRRLFGGGNEARPIALIDEEMPVTAIIPNDIVFDKTLSNLKEVESRDGRIIAITDHRTRELEEVAWEIIDVPTSNRFLMPVLTTIPLQLLAYHIAVYRGTDVTSPEISPNRSRSNDPAKR